MAKWKHRDTERWEFVKAMPRGGHRLWREKSTGRISVADHSGDGVWQGGHLSPNWYGNPDETEDGPLFLDHSRPIKITWQPFNEDDDWRHYNFYGNVSVPVVKENGEESRCGGTIASALFYVTEFGMRLEVDGTEYLVAERGKELPFLAEALEGA
jgi:hypothetical protein